MGGVSSKRLAISEATEPDPAVRMWVCTWYAWVTMNRMAMDLRVPVTRIADIVNEKRGITAETALRFARYFKNSPTFWMNLQTHYDLKMARKNLEPQAVARIKAQRAA